MRHKEVDYGVVHEFMVHLGWPNAGRCRNKRIISPTGVLTTAASSADMPRPMDRLVLLFLCELANQGAEARFNVRDIARRYDVSWDATQAFGRLHRVLSCRIYLPTEDGWQRLHIVVHDHMVWETGDVYLEFGPEFCRAAKSGAPCRVDVVRGLARKIGALDLYLLLITLIHRGQYRERWYPYEELASAKRNSRAAQSLRERLDLVTEAWPENPFRWVPRTTAITCIWRVFKGFLLHRDEAEEQRRLDREIDSRSREEFRTYLDTLPPWTRDRLMARYLERCIFTSDGEMPARPEATDAPRSRDPMARQTRAVAPDRTRDASLAPADRQTEPIADDMSQTMAETCQPSRTATQPNDGPPAMEEHAPAKATKTQPRPQGTRFGERVKPHDPNGPRPRGLLGRARARLRPLETRARDLAARVASKAVQAVVTRAPPWNARTR